MFKISLCLQTIRLESELSCRTSRVRSCHWTLSCVCLLIINKYQISVEQGQDIMYEADDVGVKKIDFDTCLEYGRYQCLRLWLFGPVLAFLGAFSYAHIFFLLQDPPQSYCQDTQITSVCSSDNSSLFGNFINILICFQSFEIILWRQVVNIQLYLHFTLR